MAITATNIASSGSDTDADEYEIAAEDFVEGRAYVLTVAQEQNGGTEPPPATPAGWTLVDSVEANNGSQWARVAVYVRCPTVTSNAEVTPLDYTGSGTIAAVSWMIDEYVGDAGEVFDVADFVKQYKTATGSTDDPTATLDNAGSAGNVVGMSAVTTSSQSVNGVESGYTQLGTQLRTSPNSRSITLYAPDVDDISPLADLNFSSAWAAFAYELGATEGGGAGAAPLTLRMLTRSSRKRP